MWLLVPFLIIPMIEIALFILVGDWLGLWPTLGLVILSVFAGIFVIRLQGVRAVNELRQNAGAMKDPLSPLAHGAMTVIAGALLILPGFFSDMIAILLLIAPLRSLIIAKLGARMSSRVHMAGFAKPGQDADYEYGRDAHSAPRRDTITVIDGEYFEVDEKAPPKGPSGWTRH